MLKAVPDHIPSEAELFRKFATMDLCNNAQREINAGPRHQ